MIGVTNFTAEKQFYVCFRSDRTKSLSPSQAAGGTDLNHNQGVNMTLLEPEFGSAIHTLGNSVRPALLQQDRPVVLDLPLDIQCR